MEASGAERDNTMRELSARRNRQRRELPAQGRAGASGGREMSHYADFVAGQGNSALLTQCCRMVFDSPIGYFPPELLSTLRRRRLFFSASLNR